MNLERYEYEIKRTYKEYFFYSEGDKGRILKVVRFVLFNYAPPSYNLVFGDWNSEGGYIDDLTVSNNGDAEKVLATVAGIIFHFTDVFRNAEVYAKGSTPARTRLYQSINKFLDEIVETFEVCGYIGNRWTQFQKNINYPAFRVVRKESIILKEHIEPYMTSTKKNKQEKKHVYNDRIIVGPELVDINNEPFVLKKMEDLRKLLGQSPLPEELLKKE